MRREDKDKATDQVIEQTLAEQKAYCKRSKDITIDNIIYDTIYLEKKRLKNKKNSKHSRTEIVFWSEMERRFYSANSTEKEEILKEIIENYAVEIAGGYNPKVYNFAIKIVPYLLKAILVKEPLWKLFSKKGKEKINKNIDISGPLDKILHLSKIGTLIVTPTHQSNFDSIVIGYSTFITGLPPMIYGAGLNLFTNPILSYMMTNLGAYKVDREKKNDLYKDVLKNYASISLEYGYHNLFYPGGTRSRSGKIEEQLKLGLLGSGLSTFIKGAKEGKKKNIYVVPCTINYELCLEARDLIEEYLVEEGSRQFILPNDSSNKIKNILAFAKKTVKVDTRIAVCFGEPLDIFGNEVNEEGISIDNHSRPIDIEKYILVDGVPDFSFQRDRVYTSILGNKILKSFLKNSVVMDTHLLSYALFKIFQKKYPFSNVYKLVSTFGAECNKELLLETISFLKEILFKKRDNGELKLGSVISTKSVDEIISHAKRQLTSYHGESVLHEQNGLFISNDLITLYYYHNKLTPYGLEKDLNLWLHQKV
ncbi:MAG: 1-acyl-sn-glycerol-3-phosphate acyltransferase [Bacteroidota bacterium]|nr:1-acyl-sn-glycerol-3-phosphate acyltransferase [Bacteroidota bacterium]